MFGYIVANPEKLNSEQRARYKGLYCGLCKKLGENRAKINKMTLTYDLVLLILVLSSVENEEYAAVEGKCMLHPLEKKIFLVNSKTEFAADMNIALAYYKFLDDWKDDKSYSAFVNMQIFKKETERIAEKYPVQCEAIRLCLDRLSEAEKANVLNPDIPADIFGELMGKIFSVSSDEKGERLFNFGKALGKYIYILDAVLDVREDIKKQRYNPLIRTPSEMYGEILDMLMADCVERYNELEIKQDSEIIENILFSGVWTQYEAALRRRKKK